jgi:hypothetical protein
MIITIRNTEDIDNYLSGESNISNMTFEEAREMLVEMLDNVNQFAFESTTGDPIAIINKDGDLVIK